MLSDNHNVQAYNGQQTFHPSVDNQRKPHMSQEDYLSPIIMKVSGVKTSTVHIHSPSSNAMEKNATQRLSVGKTRVAHDSQNSYEMQIPHRPATKATTFTFTPTATKLYYL